MSLSSEAQALFDHVKAALPKWLFGGKNAAFEWLYAFVDIFDSARSQGQEWLDDTYFDTASTEALNQHARDRGTSRRDGESDDSLRERIRSFDDVVTYPALKNGINTILSQNALPSCELVFSLRHNRAHAHSSLQATAFASRGYRMTYPLRKGYIVILPYGATALIGAAVEEFLRQAGPAGYYYIVEIRGVP